MNNMPTVKIEINWLKESIMHAFNDRHNEITEYVAGVIEERMTQLKEGGIELEINARIERLFPSILDDAASMYLRDYFNSGGGKELICNAIGTHTKEE